MPDKVVAVETDFLSALAFLEQCTRVLVIDAMDVGEQPGTLCYCRSEDLAQPGRRHSLHESGLLGVLEFLDREHRPDVHVLDVQPSRIEPGLALSPQVAPALSRIVDVSRGIIVEFARVGI